MKQATYIPKAFVPVMQRIRRESPARYARISKCPICHGVAQSECCALVNHISEVTASAGELNWRQRRAAAKAARILMPKLNVIEFLFGVKRV